MMHPSALSPGLVHRQRGVALVLILAIVVIVTVLVVALLTLAGRERRLADLSLQRTQAGALADAASVTAMATIQEAILEGSQPNTTWASEPGRITVFQIAPGSGTITHEGRDLFSAHATEDNQVDLNAPSFEGQFPIAPPAPGNTAATMKVAWQPVLRDPSQPASADNPIIGRVAWWVDDESCKVNINTADGSRKGNDGHYGGHPTATVVSGYTFGFGTPSEISLAGLPGMDQAKARAIADTAWEGEFNSVQEIVRATDDSGDYPVTRADFEALRFDVTHYNSSPDLNFMGEPRFGLVPFNRLGGQSHVRALDNYITGQNEHFSHPVRNASFGNVPIARDAAGHALPMDWIYPQPSQLPLPPYLADKPRRFFLAVPHRLDATFIQNEPAATSTMQAFVHPAGLIIANYLNGVNLQGENFTWPAFPGSGEGGFPAKYTPRQLDSITLQIMDIVGSVTMADQWLHTYTRPAYMREGWLSGEPIFGVGRTLRFNEFYLTAETSVADTFGYGENIGDEGFEHPYLQMNYFVEYYWPEGHAGTPNSPSYDTATQQLRWRTTSNAFNWMDRPGGPLDSFWSDVLLRAEDQNGNPAGIDFSGQAWQRLNGEYLEDRDQAKAALYHPYCEIFNPGPTGRYHGSINNRVSNTTTDLLRPFAGCLAETYGHVTPGTYVARQKRYRGIQHPARVGATQINLRGGIQLAQQFNGVHAASPFGALFPDFFDDFDINDAQVREELLEWVIPIHLDVPVPGTASLLVTVADPMINQLPGDWVAIPNPNPDDVTIELPPINEPRARLYRRGGFAANDPAFPQIGNQHADIIPGHPEYTLDRDGDNIGFRPAGGGDPLSVWLPRQDPRLPKQSRFPSVGALFSLRTGVFPDYANADVPMIEQRGVPFRGLNMSPSTESSQGTEGGISYPDWVMLDFFQVPFLPQKPYGPGTSLTPETEVTETQPVRRLTDGGATIGRININNPPVPYPFAEDPGINPQPPRRNALEALFYNLRPSNNYTATGEPIRTVIDSARAAEIVDGIASYQQTNGPFFLAGQIANVPEIASYLYRFQAQTSGPSRTGSISRNDVVRDTVGAITTRSNTYSVWVVAQTIRKRPGNTNYGEFEPGDTVTSEVRRRYLVERFIETGVDGIPGNVDAPAFTRPSDGRPFPNTFTMYQDWIRGDESSTSEPSLHPRMTYPLPYRWRILAVDGRIDG